MKTQNQSIDNQVVGIFRLSSGLSNFGGSCEPLDMTNSVAQAISLTGNSFDRGILSGIPDKLLTTLSTIVDKFAVTLPDLALLIGFEIGEWAGYSFGLRNDLLPMGHIFNYLGGVHKLISATTL